MKKIYFLSDMHLGARTLKNPRETEKRVVRWIDSVKDEASAIYLLGDVLDFWYEYKTVVPRGFARFFGKIAELTDNGVEVHWFIGNHDIWIFDYLPDELGIILHKEALVCTLAGKRLFLAHGDVLPGVRLPFSMQLMQTIFHSRFCQWLFAAVHPRWTVSFVHRWSSHSRSNSLEEDYKGEQSEFLVQYAKQYLEKEPINYFIFGHRHIMLDLMLRKDSRVIILGDWINYFSFAVLDETGQLTLDIFEPSDVV